MRCAYRKQVVWARHRRPERQDHMTRSPNSGLTCVSGHDLHTEALWRDHLVRGPHVCEQGALAGDTVLEHQIWYNGGGCGLEGNNTAEMYQGGGLFVPKGWIQSDYRTHGWRVCAFTLRLSRAGPQT